MNRSQLFALLLLAMPCAIIHASEDKKPSASPLDDRSPVVATICRENNTVLNESVRDCYGNPITIKNSLKNYKVRLISELIKCNSPSTHISESTMNHGLKITALIESIQRIQAFEEERS